MNIHVHTHAHIHEHATHVYAHIHACTCTHTHIGMCTHKYTYTKNGKSGNRKRKANVNSKLGSKQTFSPFSGNTRSQNISFLFLLIILFTQLCQRQWCLTMVLIPCPLILTKLHCAHTLSQDILKQYIPMDSFEQSQGKNWKINYVNNYPRTTCPSRRSADISRNLLSN